MIENTEQLQYTRPLNRWDECNASSSPIGSSDILPKNPRNFAVFAEGPLDEIRKFQAEIAAYVEQLE